MAIFDSGLVVMGTALRSAITHIQFHSADPGAAGTSNVAAGARIAVTWGAVDGDGDFQNSAVINKTDGGASAACTYVSYWTALTSGTCHGSKILTGDTSFNSAGAYSIPIGSLIINIAAI